MNMPLNLLGEQGLWQHNAGMLNSFKFRYLSLWIMVAIGATGCAGVGDRLALIRGGDKAVQLCVAAFRTVDQAVAPVADAEAARVPGFPYLRINRLLASYSETVASGRTFKTWVGHMRTLARTARAVELANLATKTSHQIKSSVARLGDCARLLQSHDLADKQGRQILRDAAQAPDHYNTVARVVGLYPFTSVPIWLGYKRLRKSQRLDFAKGLETLNTSTYAPKAAPFDGSTVRDLMRQIKRDHMGFPILSSGDSETLLNAFAPIYTVGHKSSDDKIGTPRYKSSNSLTIDTNNPAVYRRIAFARKDKKVLLQLVYTVFFPARTPSSPFDLFAGDLDGLIWRVTLDDIGQPIIYDSIHPCGCYHLFFPTPPWQLKLAVADATFGEPPLAPTSGPIPGLGQRVQLLLKPGTHYLAGIKLSPKTVAAETASYRMIDENLLRSLPTPNGNRRSLYGPDGIVEQSERSERFLLWPMGVASAGAMRQWGSHATAFIGRRHFDDPFLFEHILTRK